MIEPITRWYIATTWMGDDDYDPGSRTVVRIQATDVDDFQARVRALWPKKVISIGPVSLSKVQA